MGETEQPLQCGAVGVVTRSPGEGVVASQGKAHKRSSHLSCALKDELGILQAKSGRGRVPQEGGIVCLIKSVGVV